MAAGGSVTVRLLGPVDAVGASGELDVGGPRQRRLLALLALRVGQRVDAGELIDAVWADGGLPADPRETLRTYVSRLRRALGDPDLVAGRARGYELTLVPEAVDVVSFEAALRADPAVDPVDRLRAALGLWRGPPLAGFEHEEWARAHVARLDELRLHAADELGEALIDANRLGEAVALLEGAVAREPLRERTRRLLMQALHRDGRTADALRAFQEYRRQLATDLGLGPGDEIVAVERRILAADATPPPGEPLKGYELKERIGWGSFSEVHRAVQPSLAREVAIKRIRSELADRPDFVRRFEAEARVVARLEHPSIVPLFDYWREPGAAYLVMRWMRGGSLDARLARGPLADDEVRSLVMEIGAALGAAHRAGIVHRDVKPANILLDDGGRAFLADFGIAHDVHDRDAPVSRGSPHFAPPEQLRGERVGPEADVFGLGSVVRAALGALDGERRLRVGVVLDRATAPEPADRYASADAFVAAFDAAWHGAEGDTVADTTAVNPFKGLRAFDEADAADFVGREDQVTAIAHRLAHDGAAAVVVVGPSGSGKSSLVRAGLLPHLRAMDGGAPWYVVMMTPGATPATELLSSLRSVALDGAPGPHHDLLAAVQAAARSVVAAGGRLLLVVDQFEETYTLTTDAAERDRFIDAVVEMVRSSASGVHVVIVLRADAYDRPLAHPALAQVVAEATVVLPPLGPDEVSRAIREPIVRQGCAIEPDLVAVLATDVARQPGALPSLQYALTELFDRRTDGVLRLEHYRAFGGLSGALASRADALLAGATGARVAAARRVFRRLVVVGADGSDARRRAPRSELGADDETTAVLDDFARARLLTFDRDPVRHEPTVEVAHESLLQAWPRLRDWLADDRTGRQIHRQLSAAAGAWRDEHDDGDLLRGGRLVTVEEWAGAHGDELNDDERELLRVSVEARDADARAQAAQRAALADQNRRLRRRLLVVALTAVLAVLGGAVAVQQRGRARRNAAAATRAAHAAETRRLAADAAQIVTTNRRVGLLLAAEAYRREPGPATLATLERVLASASGLLRHLGEPTAYTAATWVDTHQVALAHAGSVDVYDTDGRRVRSLPGPTVERLVADVTGRMLVAGTTQGIRIARLDGDTGWGAPVVPDEQVQALAFGADGTLLVGTRRGLLLGIDPTTGVERFRLDAHPETAVEQLHLEGVEARPLPHLPATAVRGVAAIAVDPLSGLVATTGFGYARIWRVAAGGLPALLSQTPLVGDVDGARIATAGLAARFVVDGAPSAQLRVADAARTWTIDPADGRITSTVAASDRASYFASEETAAPIAFDGRGRLLAGFGGGFVTATEPGALTGGAQVLHGVGTPSALAVAADDDRVVTVGSEGAVLLSLRGDGPIARVLDGVGVGESAVSDSGEYVAVTDMTSFSVSLWHLGDHGPERVDLPGLHPFFAWFTPGDRLLVADRTAGAVLLDPRTRAVLATMDGWDAGAGVFPAFSLDGAQIAIASSNGHVSVFDSASGARTHTFDELAGLHAAAEGAILTFTPDGRTLLGVRPGAAATSWDLTTGSATPLGELGADTAALTVTPDGAVVSAHTDGSVTVRDAQTMQPTGVHYDATRGGYAVIGASPDGHRLFTAFGGESRLWDVASGSAIGDSLPADSTFSVYPSTSLTYAVSVRDGRLVRWDIDDSRWPDVACAVAGRDLTASEWERFGPRDAPPTPLCTRTTN